MKKRKMNVLENLYNVDAKKKKKKAVCQVNSRQSQF